jgi:hypothetical protein
MALLTISRAISTGIQRNVALSELKHEAKIADVKLSLAGQALLRMDNHAKRLTEARMEHATWLNSLDAAQQSIFDTSKADLEAAIAPASTGN